MRIVNLEEFRKLPEGVLFCKYEPCCFGELEIKGETWEYDYLTMELTGNVDCSDTDQFIEILDNAQKLKKVLI